MLYSVIYKMFVLVDILTKYLTQMRLLLIQVKFSKIFKKYYLILKYSYFVNVPTYTIL